MSKPQLRHQILVRTERLELSHQRRQNLNLVRLPIPPHPQRAPFSKPARCGVGAFRKILSGRSEAEVAEYFRHGLGEVFGDQAWAEGAGGGGVKPGAIGRGIKRRVPPRHQAANEADQNVA